MAQSVKHPTLDFGSSPDPRVKGPSPTSGSAVTAQSLLRPALPLSPCPSPAHVCVQTHALAL